MRKQFLLGLMAVLLPLAGWALADDGAEDQKALDVFDVALTGDFEETDEIEYKGSATVGVKVEITYMTPDGPQTSELTKDTHYTVSYTKDGNDVTTVKDAGNYTAIITGKGVYAGKTASKDFKIKKVELQLPDGNAITKTGATLQYGDGVSEGDELDIAQFVTLTDANGLVEDETGDELKDALKCLSVEVAVKTGLNVGDAALLRIKANKSSESTNYEYKGDAVLSDKIVVVEKTLTLAFAEGKNHGVYDGKKVELNTLDITGLDIVESDKENVTVTPSLADGKTEIKDAGDYKIKVSLTGTAAKNYVISYGEDKDALTYTVDRAKLTIEKEGNPITKVYDGTIGIKGKKDLTSEYSFKLNDEELEGGFDGLTLELNSEIAGRGINVGSHIVSLLWNGKPLSINDFEEPEIEGLTNYTIDYEREAAKNKFNVTKRPVYYYFKGGSKKYKGTEITLEDGDCELVTLTEDDIKNSGFVGDEDGWSTDPTGQLDPENTSVKDAGSYALVVDEAAKVGDNYEAKFLTKELLEKLELDEEDFENLNVFVVEQADMQIQIQEAAQTVPFGSVVDGKLTDDILNTWIKGQATYIKIGMDLSITGYQADANTARTMMTFELSDEAQSGESGDYENGLTVKVVEPEEGWNDDAKEKVWKNYKIKEATADLTIGNVEIEDGVLVLDGSEGFVTEDADAEDGEDAAEEEAEEPAEPAETETVAQKLAKYNGGIVDEVQVINLVNYAGYMDENGAKHYAKATQVIEPKKWYTLVLPFNVKISELSQQLGYAVVSVPNKDKTYINEKGNSVVTFSITLDEIPANTLMLFRVDGSKDISKGLTFTKKRIVNLTDDEKEGVEINAGIKYVPVYEKTYLEGNDLSEWYLWPETGAWADAKTLFDLVSVTGVTEFAVYPLNGYIKQPVGVSGARFFIEDIDGSTTEINAITGETIKNVAEGWYTVGGLKLNGEPTEKGVYIHDGKKVVIK